MWAGFSWVHVPSLTSEVLQLLIYTVFSFFFGSQLSLHSFHNIYLFNFSTEACEYFLFGTTFYFFTSYRYNNPNVITLCLTLWGLQKRHLEYIMRPHSVAFYLLLVSPISAKVYHRTSSLSPSHSVHKGQTKVGCLIKQIILWLVIVHFGPFSGPGVQIVAVENVSISAFLFP